MDALVTKRFHISGLTPLLTLKDISGRLSNFATVKGFDGFGLLNALNEPRNFAYVTLEGTANNLSRCQNLLNGATWKGATLRISEARPDFRARILQEREIDIRQPQRKCRKICGVETADMSIVTHQNVGSRSGWKVTAIGRLIRPMRMRPLRPLPDPMASMNEGTANRKGVEKRTKRKRIKILTRMRRKTIDPLKWNSVYIKGVFLEAERIPTATTPHSEASQDGDGSDTDEGISEVNGTRAAPSISPESRPESPTPTDHADIVREKVKSMAILRSILGEAESGGHARRSVLVSGQPNCEFPEESGVDENGVVNSPDVRKNKPIGVDPVVETPGQTNTGQEKMHLKDLFAPKEDAGGGFSIIGHLGLNLEFDDDDDIQIPSTTSPISTPRAQADTVVRPPRVVRVDTTSSKLPLFFFPAPTGVSARKRPKDVFDSARERGWDWRDPVVGFWRSESENEIRGKWESEKVELTRGWKKRWREASKTRKRAGGESKSGTVGW